MDQFFHSYLAESLWKGISTGAEVVVVVVPQGRKGELCFLWQEAVGLACLPMKLYPECPSQCLI